MKVDMKDKFCKKKDYIKMLSAKLLQISGISAELQQINATGFDN